MEYSFYKTIEECPSDPLEHSPRRAQERKPRHGLTLVPVWFDQHRATQLLSLLGLRKRSLARMTAWLDKLGYAEDQRTTLRTAV